MRLALIVIVVIFLSVWQIESCTARRDEKRPTYKVTYRVFYPNETVTKCAYTKWPAKRFTYEGVENITARRYGTIYSGTAPCIIISQTK